MAKEAGKPSTKKKKEPKKKKRPAYCPNTSKSFNLSISRSKRFEVSSSALKKNNEELAKNLNLYKVAVARLEKERATQEAEIMDLRMEIGQLRAAPDPQDVEAEVQRRVKEHMAKINGDIRAAIDHSIGLSTILTQLCVTSSRASVSSSSQTAISRPRSSDIGGSRMRQVVTNRTNNAGNNGNNAGNTWTRGSGKCLMLLKLYQLNI